MNKFENIRIDNVKPTILCVDDEAEVAAGLTEILMRAGYSCECCGDGRSAMDSLSRHLPDLIIADIQLGDEDGLTLCAQIKAQPSMAEVPIVILSGADIPNVIHRVREAGASYYLRKPFDPEVLLELIDKSLWMPNIVNNRTRPNSAQMPNRDGVRNHHS
jgi:two-component system chemotaxis response regulator CheY